MSNHLLHFAETNHWHPHARCMCSWSVNHTVAYASGASTLRLFSKRKRPSNQPAPPNPAEHTAAANSDVENEPSGVSKRTPRQASAEDVQKHQGRQHPIPRRSRVLPPAYHTVLCEPSHVSSNSVLSWTADDTFEAADREAIKRAEQARLARHASAQSELPPAPTVITRIPEHLQPDVLENAMLLLDKPLDWEAEEVARSLRWALKNPKLGYAGTLDAGATGLMLVLFGKATSLTSLFLGLGSRYTATVRLGTSTDTYDAAGRVTAICDWTHVTDEDIARVGQQLLGQHVQVPPILTPVKVRGKPMVDLARPTPKDDLLPRPVVIRDLVLERQLPGSPDLHLDVTFARTGYVRSLAHDIGHHLGCGAHVVSWRREDIGGFKVDHAWTLDILLPVARKYISKKIK